jgi:hypothetical protein
MAENESLDLADSKRFLSVYHSVRQGKSIREVADKCQRAICGGLRATFKAWAKKGLSRKDIQAARHDPQSMHDTLTECLDRIGGDGWELKFVAEERSRTRSHQP